MANQTLPLHRIAALCNTGLMCEMDKNMLKVMFALMRHMDIENGSCNPGYDRLAHVAMIPRSSVARSVKKLEKLGLIRVTQGHTGRTSKAYVVLPMASPQSLSGDLGVVASDYPECTPATTPTTSGCTPATTQGAQNSPVEWSPATTEPKEPDQEPQGGSSACSPDGQLTASGQAEADQIFEAVEAMAVQLRKGNPYQTREQAIRIEVERFVREGGSLEVFEVLRRSRANAEDDSDEQVWGLVKRKDSWRQVLAESKAEVSARGSVDMEPDAPIDLPKAYVPETETPRDMGKAGAAMLVKIRAVFDGWDFNGSADLFAERVSGFIAAGGTEKDAVRAREASKRKKHPIPYLLEIMASRASWGGLGEDAKHKALLSNSQKHVAETKDDPFDAPMFGEDPNPKETTNE